MLLGQSHVVVLLFDYQPFINKGDRIANGFFALIFVAYHGCQSRQLNAGRSLPDEVIFFNTEVWD